YHPRIRLSRRLAMHLLLLGAALTFGVGGEPSPGRVGPYDEGRPGGGPASAPSDDLWLAPPDLLRATRFVVKPEGVCRDEMCVPLPRAPRSEFLSARGGAEWFNLSAFARLLHQPAAHDAGLGVWYFG